MSRVQIKEDGQTLGLPVSGKLHCRHDPDDQGDDRQDADDGPNESASAHDVSP